MQLRDMHGSWRFFASVIDDIESQLARTRSVPSPSTTASWPRRGCGATRLCCARNTERCRDAVLAIKEEADLLDGDRTQQRAIQLRNPYVDPMNLMQVDLLRRWRATAREDDDLLQALLASVSGIAQGLQTTGADAGFPVAYNAAAQVKIPPSNRPVRGEFSLKSAPCTATTKSMRRS